MRRELLIAVGPGEWRAAWLEDDVAVELHVERGDVRPAGSIHLGRLVRRLAGLDAALVEIGEARPGFLPLREPLDEGARVVVQVTHEAQHDKGARLATRFVNADAAGLAAQAARLTPPAQLHPAAGFAPALALRWREKPQRVLCDDAGALRELREAFADVQIEHRAADQWPVDIEALFAAALAPRLQLPGGGSVHIEESRAATLIDVDTGVPDETSLARGALATNLEAAAAIARHLRLRQLGGGIIVDFAALDGRRARVRLEQAMAHALAGDPGQPQVLGWTRLGHLEVVRSRRLRPLSAAMLEPSGVRKSATALAFEALRSLQREARARPAANWRLVVNASVAAVLQGSAASALRALEARLGRSIGVAVAKDGGGAFDIVAI